MQVSRWGDSLAIRLPNAVVDALELKEGDEIEIQVAGARAFAVARKPMRDELVRRLDCFAARAACNDDFWGRASYLTSTFTGNRS